jgi:translation initiation factor 1
VVENSRLVYSTGDGDQRSRGKKRPEKSTRGPELPRDGVVRIFRDKGRRGGKAVTVVRGLPRKELAAVATDLKKLCGSGGSVKDDAVEIQGDHREQIAAHLTAQGHTVKLAGG